MDRFEVLGTRQIMDVVESLDSFNFDLAETLIDRVLARVVGRCGAVSGGGIDRHRCQAVAKRVHSRTRFAFLTAWAATLCAIALVRSDLPWRRHQLTSSTPAADRRRWQRWPFL